MLAEARAAVTATVPVQAVSATDNTISAVASAKAMQLCDSQLTAVGIMPTCLHATQQVGEKSLPGQHSSSLPVCTCQLP